MKHAALSDLGVSRETESRLDMFAALLLRWNARINLVAEHDAPLIWHRHILDSAQLAPLFPPLPGPVVDLGSGAGFPGLILALITGRETHLVEADRRKAAFLREAARHLDIARLHIHPERIAAADLPRAAIVTARALAPLVQLLPHAHRILRPEGSAIFPKGRAAETELAIAVESWTMVTERFPSLTDPAATILRLSALTPKPPHG